MAFLTVNKTGTIFVLLDPNSPSQYNTTIIRQIKAVALLISSSYKKILADTISTHIAISGAIINQYLPVIFFQPVILRLTNIAYYLFISRSTGAPQDYLVSHSTLASISNHTALLRLNKASHILQFAPFMFRISIIKI